MSLLVDTVVKEVPECDSSGVVGCTAPALTVALPADGATTDELDTALSKSTGNGLPDIVGGLKHSTGGPPSFCAAASVCLSCSAIV